MAINSLSKSSPKLNLTRRQAELFQRIILVGNRMSDTLSALDKTMSLPRDAAKLVHKWQKLMITLANMLI